MTFLADFEFPIMLPMTLFAVATFSGEFGVNDLWGKNVSWARFTLALVALAGIFGLCRIWGSLEMLLWALPAWLLADLFSCLFHFLGDTLRLPSFWEHHTDPMIMTHLSFLFRNAEIMFLGAYLSPLIIAVLPSIKPMLDLTVMLAMFSNETHRWAHLRRVNKPIPAVVARLQDWGLILTPERHARHHRGTFNTHFSIFAGVCDPVTGPVFTPVHDFFHPPESENHPASAKRPAAGSSKSH